MIYSLYQKNKEKKMNIEMSDNENIKNFAQKALCENLFIEGFDLKKALNKILKSQSEKLKTSFIILLKNGEEYIGISTFLMTEYVPIHTFIKKEYRNKGYGKFLINEIVKNVPNKFKARISFGLGEIDSLFFFYNMIERGDISVENIKDDGQKTQINVLKTYIFCKKNNLDTKIFTPNLFKIFSEEEINSINKYIENCL